LPRVKVKPLGDLWKIMKRHEYLNLKDGANVYDLIKAIDDNMAPRFGNQALVWIPWIYRKAPQSL